MLLGRQGGKGKLFPLGEGMTLPRCGISFCLFAPNPALSSVIPSVQIICWVISRGQSQNEVSQGRQARDGGMSPLNALPRKEPPHPDHQGQGDFSLKSQGNVGHLVLQLQLGRAWAIWMSWHLQPCSCHLSKCSRGKGEQNHRTHNSSVQEPSVNLRSSNSQSQPDF